MHISRIAEGRIVERWGQGENLGLMQQPGAVPTPGAEGVFRERRAEGVGAPEGDPRGRDVGAVIGGVETAPFLGPLPRTSAAPSGPRSASGSP
jgi:hypothetical protein